MRLYGGDGWSTTGNTGITAANFLGTINNFPLRIRTNNALRFEFTTNGRLRSENNGDAVQPTYAWLGTGGTNTGMFRPAANTLAFSTSGTERIRVGNNGRVGINTTAFIGRLDVRDNFNTTLGGISTIYSLNANASGTGLSAVGQNGIPNALVAGSGGSFSGVVTGLYTFYSTPGIGDGIVVQDNFGAQWQVGHWSGLAYYKIIGVGLVSTIVKDTNEENVVLVCPEAPEAVFQDYGVGQLVNGETYIELDPIITRNIIVDETHPLKVFIQPEGECNGVYVTNKSSFGFTVKELNQGSSTIPFSYQIVATRNDEMITSENGDTRLVSYKGRFSKAPTYKENLGRK